MVDAQVVDLADGHLRGHALEAGHAVTGHAEVDDDVTDGLHGQVGGELERRLQQVAVEHHVQVLVGRDARQHAVADRVARLMTGVAVRDAGRELLEGDVRDRVQHRVSVVRLEALAHVLHAEGLELVRVHRARGEQVVAHDDAVPALLRGPAVHPGAPGAVPAEQGRDLVVVAREVVLGEQVDDERDPADLGDLGLLLVPGLAVLEDPGEVAGVAEGHILVRHPVLGHLQVAVELRLDDFLQRVQQASVGPGGSRAAEVGRSDRHGCSRGTGQRAKN